MFTSALFFVVVVAGNVQNDDKVEKKVKMLVVNSLLNSGNELVSTNETERKLDFIWHILKNS